MILQLLIGTIAATTAPTMPSSARTAATAPPPARIVVVPTRPRERVVCRIEFGIASLVQRVRVCHAAAEWRAIDGRRRQRRLQRR